MSSSSAAHRISSSSASISLRPPAFVQVDVDGLWAVRQCYDSPAAGTFHRDPVWMQGVPEFRSLFREMGIKASFFLVGRDLDIPSKRHLAESLAEDGHEIGNHSFTHILGLTKLKPEELRREIVGGHDAIVNSGLPAPVGFRAPGYDVDARVLAVLRGLKYKYDASMLPTALGPMMRVADAFIARKWQPGKRQFGKLAHASAPRVPYFPDPRHPERKASPADAKGMMELPVGTLPPWRLPLTAAAIFSFGPEKVLAGLKTCLERRRPTLLLLHGIDLVDCSKPLIFDHRKTTLAGFDLPLERKRAQIEPILQFIKTNFQIHRADQWAVRYIDKHRESAP